MDKIGICICRVYCALNKLHTAGLSDKELEELSDKVVSIIDKTTHSRTPKFLHYKSTLNEDIDELGNDNKANDDKKHNTTTDKLNISPERENVIETDPKVSQPDPSNNKTSDKNKVNKKCTKEMVNVQEENKIEDTESSENVNNENTNKTKRVRWDCNSCISKCDKGKEDNVSICSECYRMFEKTGKTNKYYQRTVKEIPSNCKACPYISYNEDYGKYVCNVNYKLDGETGSYHHYIRANYLEKNRPGFCKCK